MQCTNFNFVVSSPKSTEFLLFGKKVVSLVFPGFKINLLVRCVSFFTFKYVVDRKGGYQLVLQVSKKGQIK